MFYDWRCIFYGGLVEHPCVAVCSSLCVGKKDKKEVKTLGSPPGDLLQNLLLKLLILLNPG
jgi:hypothetical protein